MAIWNHELVYSEVELRRGAALWRSTGGAGSVIAADGCLDLILREDVVLISGPSTQWIGTLPDGEGSSVGLRLPPGEAASLAGVPLVELADITTALDAVVSRRESDAIAALLRGVACGLDSVTDVAAVLGEGEPTGWVAFARCSATHLLSARDVATELEWSERTLRRRMLATFGYGYATLVRIERARRACSMLRSGASVSDTAVLSGYADQPHLSREFKRLVGKSPGQFVASTAKRSIELPSGSTSAA